MEASNYKTYIKQNNLSGFSALKFRLKVYCSIFKTHLKLLQTLRKKECFVGPFKGEFGHMLAHNAPFMMYLHKKGVKINYCGMTLHLPLLVNDQKKSIITNLYPLRDFFAEVSPRTNSTIPPDDVKREIQKFKQAAFNSGLPFWNLDDDFYYWFVHRHFVSHGHASLYDLKKAYQTSDENSVAIFPRSKGAAESINNGKSWDYNELVEILSPYFDKVYVVGHPSQVLTIESRKNIEVCITADNSVMLQKCANSKLIVTQHSGTTYLSEYLNTPVLIIYKGGNTVGSLNNTLYYKKSLGQKNQLSVAYSEEEIITFIKTKKYEKT